jgi:hypothetical protein
MVLDDVGLTRDSEYSKVQEAVKQVVRDFNYIAENASLISSHDEVLCILEWAYRMKPENSVSEEPIPNIVLSLRISRPEES